MHLLKSKIVRMLVLLFSLLLLLLFGSIYINFYVSSLIEEKVSKRELVTSVTEVLNGFKSNFNDKAKEIYHIESKLKFLENEKGKFLFYTNILAQDELIVLFFQKDTPFYKINQPTGFTDFFYMSKFDFEFKENGAVSRYVPHRLLRINRKISNYQELTNDEKKLLTKKSFNVLNSIKNDIQSIMNKLEKSQQTNDKLNFEKVQNEYIELINKKEKLLTEEIDEFTPDIIINLLTISKFLIIGIIGFLAIIVIIIIRQLIDGYNKVEIIETLMVSGDSLDRDKINKQKELIIAVNEFYKNKKEESKDIIIEAIKATNNNK